MISQLNRQKHEIGVSTNPKIGGTKLIIVIWTVTI